MEEAPPTKHLDNYVGVFCCLGKIGFERLAVRDALHQASVSECQSTETMIDYEIYILGLFVLVECGF